MSDQPLECPICNEVGGFHDEDIHASRPIAEGKALPLIEAVPNCRACGEPVNAPGLPDCRYPGHKESVND